MVIIFQSCQISYLLRRLIRKCLIDLPSYFTEGHDCAQSRSNYHFNLLIMYFFICFFIGNVLVALVKLQHSLNNDDAMARLFNHIEGHFQSIGVFAFVVKNIWNKFREKKKKKNIWNKLVVIITWPTSAR